MDLENISDDKLRTLEQNVANEWGRRRQAEPVAFGCCECNYEDTDSDQVYTHLRIVHGYPEEDANLGTEPIYVR